MLNYVSFAINTFRAAANFEEMAAGTNKRRLIQHTVFQELCKVSAHIFTVNTTNFLYKDCQHIRKYTYSETVGSIYFSTGFFPFLKEMIICNEDITEHDAT